MDTGKGELAEISQEKATELYEKDVKGVFITGEIVELKGSRFRIQNITPKRLILKILPDKKGPNPLLPSPLFILVAEFRLESCANLRKRYFWIRLKGG